MRFAIQARLDGRSRKRLAVLVRELGWTPSRVVREGLRVLEASYLRRKKPGIIGLGKFKSGVPELGTSNKHLRSFGRRSRSFSTQVSSLRCWTAARVFTRCALGRFERW